METKMKITTPILGNADIRNPRRIIAAWEILVNLAIFGSGVC